MARLARIVIPGVAHHVTQRGNRRLPIFFRDDDRTLYLRLVREGCAAARVRCLAWCLMDNHVHLVLGPDAADGLRAALAEAHRRYTREINFREGWRGYLFAGQVCLIPDGRRPFDGRGPLRRDQPGGRAPGRPRRGLALVERAQP
jgi:putative transposase